MRVLVVSNMLPSADYPQRGSFIRDQVAGLRELGIEVEAFDWLPGASQYGPATRRLRSILARGSFDLVHAHYGLAGWCASLAGAAPLLVTFHGTDVRHRLVGPLSRRLTAGGSFVAAVSAALFKPEAGRPGLPRPAGRSAVLPCGANFARFEPRGRAQARERLGLDPDGRYLLFPASPGRAVKRHDRAAAVAERASAELLTLGSAAPETVCDRINAAAAVLVPSDNEGFGLAAVEALACDVPVLSTPVGIAPHLLSDLHGCLVAPFEVDDWTAACVAHLDREDPRVEGRKRAEPFSSTRMAERVAAAYRDIVGFT